MHFRRVDGTPLDYGRYTEVCGWDSVRVHDMNEVYGGMLDRSEVARVEKLELFDELEEWHLINAHYSVAIAVCSAAKIADSAAARSDEGKAGEAGEEGEEGGDGDGGDRGDGGEETGGGAPGNRGTGLAMVDPFLDYLDARVRANRAAGATAEAPRLNTFAKKP